MKRVDLRGATEAEISFLLAKPAFDEVAVSDRTRNRIRQTFGADLPPVELVGQIVQKVRKYGDKAVLEYTRIIDGVSLIPDQLEVSATEKAKALAGLEPALLSAMTKAAKNVRQFHQEQKERDCSWTSNRGEKSWVGQRRTPIDRVGVYIPGGTAAYPSSVLMTVVPAVVAGVGEVIITVPPSPDGSVNPLVLAAAEIAGAHRIFRIGGAQAIAAMAFGTATVPKADKIVGPGNLFVTLAKKAVYGYCDIDMLAGPSEIMILADESAVASHVAADMLSQAEHDELASSILVTDSEELASQVEVELEKQLACLPRAGTARAALKANGMILIAQNMKQAIQCVNAASPEHLELLTVAPQELLTEIRHAGAIFVGKYSPEPLGDYFAGPSHVLPTGGTARFASVLNVDTFMKTTSVICYSAPDLEAASEDIITLAEAEGLAAHARAVSRRR